MEENVEQKQIVSLGLGMSGISGLLTPEIVDGINDVYERQCDIADGRIGQDRPQLDPDARMYLPEEESGTNDPNTRISDIRWGEHTLLDKVSPGLSEQINSVIMDIAGFSMWNFYSGYVEQLQHTTYRADPNGAGHYSWHEDAGLEGLSMPTMRKLSATIQLSDPEDYEGGLFQWLTNAKISHSLGRTGKANAYDLAETLPYSMMQKGSIIVFPSTVMHQVTPVLSGERKSLVIWLSGPPWDSMHAEQPVAANE